MCGGGRESVGCDVLGLEVPCVTRYLLTECVGVSVAQEDAKAAAEKRLLEKKAKSAAAANSAKS